MLPGYLFVKVGRLYYFHKTIYSCVDVERILVIEIVEPESVGIPSDRLAAIDAADASVH